MRMLPAQFAELEHLARVWSLATETERNQRRLESSFSELQAFADALVPHLDAIFKHLEAYPLADLPEEESRLFYLTLSLAEVAPALECYGQPAVINGFDSVRMPATEGFKLRPIP